MPLNDVGSKVPTVPNVPDPTTYSGELYAFLLFFFIGIILILAVFWLIIKLWGSPIMSAKTAFLTGSAVVQHFENSKIGFLKLAHIGGGALRHQKVEDGTLIAIPKGINNLNGTQIVNSWNLTGISIPTFLIGAITKLRSFGYLNRPQLEAAVLEREAKRAELINQWNIAAKELKAGLEFQINNIVDLRYTNLIQESYNFNSFQDVLNKSQHPVIIPLEPEFINDFIAAQNQHYMESDITGELQSYFQNASDQLIKTVLITGIGVFIASLGIYFMTGGG